MIKIWKNRYLCLWPFCFVSYVENLPARTEGSVRRGQAIMFFISIVQKYAEDKGLLAHERKHVRQWWRRPFTFGTRYKNDPVFRLNAEVEAFAAQCKEYGSLEKAPSFGKRIAAWYDLTVTPEQAEAAVRHAYHNMA